MMKNTLKTFSCYLWKKKCLPKNCAAPPKISEMQCPIMIVVFFVLLQAVLHKSTLVSASSSFDGNDSR